MGYPKYVFLPYDIDKPPKIFYAKEIRASWILGSPYLEEVLEGACSHYHIGRCLPLDEETERLVDEIRQTLDKLMELRNKFLKRSRKWAKKTTKGRSLFH